VLKILRLMSTTTNCIFAAFCLGLAAVVPAQGQFFEQMDFGPCLTTTMQSKGIDGDTLKALVVKMPGGGTAAFDTEALRMSSIWTDGWLRLRGTPYDGSHGPLPTRRGQAVASVRPGPGWAYRRDFADIRKDGRGPIDKSRGSYNGYWMHGNRVVISYVVDGMEVLESPVSMGSASAPTVLRSFEFGPSDRDQQVLLATAPLGIPGGALDWQISDGREKCDLTWYVTPSEPVQISGSTVTYDRMSMGAPSDADYLDQARGNNATVRFVPGFARTHHAPKLAEGSADDAATTVVTQLNDGKPSQNEDDWPNSVWFDKLPNGSDQGRYHVDLQQEVEITRINTYSWHRGPRAIQDYQLFGSAAETPPAADAADPEAAGWQHLADVNTSDMGRGDRHGASVWRASGVGRFRHLLMVVRSGGAFFNEIDVYTSDCPAACDDGSLRQEGVRSRLVGGGVQLVPSMEKQGIMLFVPAHDSTLRVGVVMAPAWTDESHLVQFAEDAAPEDLSTLASPGAKRWGEAVVTKGRLGDEEGPYAVDTITIPFENPYSSRMRTCAFDFFSDGRAAITTWNGDVWIVGGLDEDLDELRWTRFATGLYDPLGLRIVGDVVHVHGRDGITRLQDLNGDGEADYYECFNHDVLITPSFHEFAFDLQTDAAGNFYCSKGAPVKPGGRGFDEIVAHHGTILRISRDGQRLDVMATGLRAPNGIGVSPDGVLTSGDNEGTWMPRCRLNWITRPGYYAGVRDTAHRTQVPEMPDLPLCWMPMEIDNSSGGQVWVTRDDWGPLQDRLLHLSYGTCGLYLVLKEEVDGVVQGGVVRFPTSFSSSAMRARFHPFDHQLYLAGFQGWQTSAAREGGFHRIRYTGKALHMPLQLRTCDRGVYLTFDTTLDRELAEDPMSYGVEIWNYIYSENYGSPEVSLLEPERKVERGKPNRDELVVRSAKLSDDGRTVFLEVAGMRPVHQMKISYNLDSADGERVKGEVHNTIHVLAEDPGMPR
jgi:hypothetical protein